jgi:hypothetical protein
VSPEQPAPLAPGDRVILARSEPSGWAEGLPRRPWVVVACPCGLCRQGSHVALDVPTHPALLAEDPDRSPWVHVGAAALRRRGELSSTQAEAWCDALAAGCGVGQALHWATEDGREAVARLVAHEFAALVLADSLGGMELTEAQGYQLELWRGQRGGRPC